MPVELTLLTLSAILCVLLAFTYPQQFTLKYGPSVTFGNREDAPALTGWAGRAKRAHANMVENLVPFAAVVLVAQAAGKLGTLTLVGAYLFFFGRVAHAALYIAGIPVARTLAFGVSLTGMAMFVVALFA